MVNYKFYGELLSAVREVIQICLQTWGRVITFPNDAEALTLAC